MAVYYKPQSPIQSGEDFIYPITTADQVKVDKDTRLNAVGVYLKNIDNSTDTTVYGNNATTLGGVAAEDYALKTDTAPDSSKLGGVAASGYALKTDTAPDSTKLGGKAPEYYIQPRNLLDNSDFRNPVNQRGQTILETAGAYWLDRWKTSSNGYYDVKDTSIGINSNQSALAGVEQKLANTAHLNGKTLTLAVFARAASNNAKMRLCFPYVEEVTNVPLTSEFEIYTYTTVFQENDAGNSVAVFAETGSSIEVKWAALYEGSYTADTLPPYVPKGYAAELAECQRYFRKGAQAVTIGTQYSSGSLFSLSVPRMRIKPTVTLTEISSQGWGNVTASNYTLEWNGDLGSSFYQNYVSSVSNDAGKTVVVSYEMSADL